MAFSMFIILFLLLPKAGILDFAVIPIALYAFFLYHKNKRLIITKELEIILFIWLILFLVALLSFIYHGSIYNAIIFKPIRQIILIIIFSIIFIHKEYTIQDLLKIVLIASTINSGVVLLQYMAHLTLYIDDLLIVPGFNEDITVIFRKPGLYTGYPPAGMMAVVGFVISFYFIKKKFALIYIVTLILSIVALMLTSRMALLIALLYSLFLIPYVAFSGKKQLLALVITIVSMIILIGVLISNEYVHRDTVKVMFELFINFANGEGIKSNSGTALVDSYIGNYPQYITTVLFGNGLTIKSDIGLTIDAGPQILLFGGGIITLMLYYYLFILYFKLSKIKEKDLYITYGLLFLLIFISNLKGAFLFGRPIGDAVLVLVIGSYFYYYKRKKGLIYAKQ